MAVYALIELAGDAADRLLVADVRAPKAAGGQAADVPARLDQHDALAHAGGLHGRGRAGGSRAVNDHVGPLRGRCGRNCKDDEKKSGVHIALLLEAC